MVEALVVQLGLARARPVLLAGMVAPFLVWLELVRGRSPRTIEDYGHDLRAFLTFCGRVGLHTPRLVTFREIEVYVAWLQRERGVGPVTVNRHLNALRSFWTYLVREGLAMSNPGKSVFSLKTPARVPRYLSVEDQERVLAALSRNLSPLGLRAFAVVATGLFTGVRSAELRAIRVADVDLGAGVLRVIGKGNRERELPVVPRLTAILLRYLRVGRPRLLRGLDCPWLFVAARGGRRGLGQSPGRPPMGEEALTGLLRSRVDSLVGSRVRFHMFRHSFASRLREAGADLQFIQEILGHAHLSTTAIYAHLSTARRRAELARLLGAGWGVVGSEA